jgi:hypothetical protein
MRAKPGDLVWMLSQEQTMTWSATSESYDSITFAVGSVALVVSTTVEAFPGELVILIGNQLGTIHATDVVVGGIQVFREEELLEAYTFTDEDYRTIENVTAQMAHDQHERGASIAKKVQGIAGEIAYARLTRSMDWWLANRESLKGASDDGGYDTFDGRDVKTCVPGNRFVSAKRTARKPPNGYVAIEVTMEGDTPISARVIGRFGPQDIEDNVEGTRFQGVPRKRFRE